ncbi:MAG: ribosome small subunit-dependent GTPase A [Herpetosiphonaceae bacterium]|nr:ribosome small subunit-dependent GTPase A [Herpetosiphonaceae bacterium]
MTQTGTVVKAQSGFFWVAEGDEVVRCVLRGRLKKSRVPTDIATLGDRVQWTPTSNGEGVIEAVAERHSKLARRAAGSKGIWKEDVLVANLDQVLTVFAVANPTPHLRMLDRYLVMAELNNIDAIIIGNKCDLRPQAEIEALFAPYMGIGYRVLLTSVRAGIGVDAVQELLKDKISALSGPSGVGKSSMLNAVQPGLGLRVSDVSGDTGANHGRGRHTTVHPELITLDFGGFVADTPGIRELGLWQVPPADLDWCYREFRPFIGDCRFQPCSHVHEPECAIQAAVKRGEINEIRYDSYVRMREEVDSAVLVR